MWSEPTWENRNYCKVSLGVASLSLLVKAEKLNWIWLSTGAAAGGRGTEQTAALGQPRQAGRFSLKLLAPHATLSPPRWLLVARSAGSHIVLDAQSCLTLCDPMDCSQAKILEWVAIPFSKPQY